MRRLLFVALALALVAAGCGGVDSEPNLAQAAERTEALGSGRFEVRGHATQDTPADFACMGAADYARRSVHVECDYANLGEFEAIAIGRDFYMRGAGSADFATGGKWIKGTGDVEDDSLAALSPQRLLTMLKAASNEIERVGEEDVRGVSTVRYRLTVDCAGASLECETDAPVDVWIGDDGLLRRIDLDDEGGTATFEFFDFGAEIDIEPPQADEIVDFSEGWTGYGPSERGDAAPCSEGEATPISVAKARETLRRHGFSVTVDRSGYCIEGVAAVLANAPEDFDEHGSVSCFLAERPAPGAPATVVRRGADGADAELGLRNLECTIFTDSPTGEEKIDRLEAAFEELQRAIRP